MVEIKKFQRGHRTYTRWGGKIKEVKINPVREELNAGRGFPVLKLTNLHATEDQKQGKYTNYVIVSSNETEFVLDFYYQYSHLEKGNEVNLPHSESPVPTEPITSLVIRLIANPVHSKRLALVLQDSITRYEKQYGKIKI